jgi:AraC-like DNA-binding protein
MVTLAIFCQILLFVGMFTTAHIPRMALRYAGQILPDPEWHCPLSRHPHHELIVVVAGAIRVASGAKRVQAGTGSVLLYPAGAEHEEWSDREFPLRSLFMVFTGPGLKAMPVTVFQDARHVVRDLAARIYADRDASTAAARAQRTFLLQAMLAELLRSRGAEDQPMVADVRRHIRSHIAATLTLEELAGVSGLSKFHFLRTYRAATGRTPMEDVRNIRAEHARELILSTRLPLKEIAPKAGLGDEYSLSRLFRRLYNAPPGDLRRVRA